MKDDIVEDMIRKVMDNVRVEVKEIMSHRER